MSSPSRARILFVDDEPDLLDSLADVWGLDYDVRTALGADQALAVLAEWTPHVVVSDMRMPGMDGAALLARVRDRAPTAVRLLLTGHADLDAAMRAVNDGGVYKFLTKPCPPHVLGPELERALAYRDQLAHTDRLATLGTMAASLSHEMNNTLAILEGAVEEVRSDVESGLMPAEEVLQALVHGKDRLIAQTRGTLSLGKRAQSSSRPLDVAATIREIGSVISTLGVTRHAAVSVTTTGEPAWIVGDRTELEQVVINLVKNSSDAIAERGGTAGRSAAEAQRGSIERSRTGTIEISVQAHEGRVLVRVADNGGGIPDGILARVFEPYFTTKGAGTGTGLGLPLVKRMVEAWGGTVAIASQSGVGTMVTLDVPRWMNGATTRTRSTSKSPVQRPTAKQLALIRPS